MTCGLPVRTPELLHVFVDTLANRHFASLAVFAIDPRGKDMLSYLVGTEEIKLITTSCRLLTEVAFGLKEVENVSTAPHVSTPGLHVSPIRVENMKVVLTSRSSGRPNPHTTLTPDPAPSYSGPPSKLLRRRTTSCSLGAYFALPLHVGASSQVEVRRAG